jgi:hypothetical protein
MPRGQRLAAVLLLVLATLGFLLSLAGAVGVWFIREPVRARTTRVFERVEAALERAERGLDLASVSLARAEERLTDTRERRVKAGQETPPNAALRRGLTRTVRRGLGGEIDGAQEKLRTVAEAAVAVNSVLEDMGGIPLLAGSGLDTEGLARASEALTTAGQAAWGLSQAVGDPEGDSDVGIEASRVERALQEAQRLLAESRPRLPQALQRARQLRSRASAWIGPGAAVLSAVCFWTALSQVCVALLAWSWWKGPGG